MADLLVIDNLAAGYGAARVIAGLDLRLAEGRSLALLGRNGAGKTTLLNSLIGATTRHGGRILFAGADVTRLKPHQRARAGLGWAPQERNIFRSLSVEENLTAVALPGPWTLARVYALFPRLRERARIGGAQLSGGEQQMLAIGRALMLNPRLLLLDEPTEGLAPILVDEVLGVLRRLARDEGLSMIVVEQKAHEILPFTDAAIILDRGAIVHAGPSAALAADAAALEAHLTAAGRG
jgi:branched-chain amino acid transport system ATP-binding protein